MGGNSNSVMLCAGVSERGRGKQLGTNQRWEGKTMYVCMFYISTTLHQTKRETEGHTTLWLAGKLDTGSYIYL